MGAGRGFWLYSELKNLNQKIRLLDGKIENPQTVVARWDLNP